MGNTVGGTGYSGGKGAPLPEEELKLCMVDELAAAAAAATAAAAAAAAAAATAADEEAMIMG